MRISLTLEITRDRPAEAEPEETIQPDMSGANIEVSSGVSAEDAMELARRRVGFGAHP